MSWLRNMALAFSLFSRLPMPQVAWDPPNRRYALCFFPLVGIVIGLVLGGWLWLSSTLALGAVLFATGLTALPLLVHGGIHLDGWCDTLDALASHAGADRRHEIMKDPHAGVFAVIGLALYLLVYVALGTELLPAAQTILVLGLVHVMTRILCGLAVLLIPAYSSSGLCAAFQQAAAKTRVTVVLAIMLLLCAAGLIWISPAGGSGILLAGLAGSITVHHLARRRFAGMSGDLAGFYLQLTELLMLLAWVLFTKGGWS